MKTKLKSINFNEMRKCDQDTSLKQSHWAESDLSSRRWDSDMAIFQNVVAF